MLVLRPLVGGEARASIRRLCKGNIAVQGSALRGKSGQQNNYKMVIYCPKHMRRVVYRTTGCQMALDPLLPDYLGLHFSPLQTCSTGAPRPASAYAL